MEMNDEQKQAVEAWAAEGMGLSDIQKKIQEEFGLAMTYMDVRFLVLDLGAEVRDKPESRQSQPADITASAQDTPGGSGGVSVDIDVITKPGSVVSGTVVFSDGVKANWFLDQTGRLAIDAGGDGYKPGEQDLKDFQQELQAALRKKGF